LSVAYATHESKKLREDPKTCGVVKFACKEKAPRRGEARDFGPTHNGISLFHGLSRAAFDELGFFG
jgi:hypothetical protein